VPDRCQLSKPRGRPSARARGRRPWKRLRAEAHQRPPQVGQYDSYFGLIKKVENDPQVPQCPSGEFLNHVNQL
jgi:hypothetical protein